MSAHQTFQLHAKLLISVMNFRFGDKIHNNATGDPLGLGNWANPPNENWILTDNNTFIRKIIHGKFPKFAYNLPSKQSIQRLRCRERETAMNAEDFTEDKTLWNTNCSEIMQPARYIIQAGQELEEKCYTLHTAGKNKTMLDLRRWTNNTSTWAH